jgi:hypothetical protein
LKGFGERQPSAFGETESVVNERRSIGHRQTLMIFDQKSTQLFPIFCRVVDAVVAVLIDVELHPLGALRDRAEREKLRVNFS